MVTRVIVLGTDHSPQLAVRAYKPAVLRAYLLRLRPDAICVESTPEAFARGTIPDFMDEARFIAAPFASAHAFTFDGLGDRRRLDSYFDPFGGLCVRQRALLEAAREAYKCGDAASGDAMRTQLAAELTPPQAAHLAAYWPAHVQSTP